MTRPRDYADVREPLLLEMELRLSAKEWAGVMAMVLAAVYVAASVIHTTISLVEWAVR